MTKYQIAGIVLFCIGSLLWLVLNKLRKTPGYLDEVFNVKVHGDRGLGELIHDTGFDVRVPGLSEFQVNNPHNRCAGMEIYGICWKRSLVQVFREIEERGYLPANAEEMLCFCREHRRELRRYPVWALGARAHIHGRDMVMGANCYGRVYTLTYGEAGRTFDEGDAFLVVPKGSRPLK